MMVFLELTAPRRKRLEVPLDMEALPRLTDFLSEFASKAGWGSASSERLVLIGEETLASLLSEEGGDIESDKGRRLVVSARVVGGGAELEFVSAAGEENLEDRLAYLGERPDISDGRGISFRSLRHYASSVRHQKYHWVDIVTVQVESSR